MMRRAERNVFAILGLRSLYFALAEVSSHHCERTGDSTSRLK